MTRAAHRRQWARTAKTARIVTVLTAVLATVAGCVAFRSPQPSPGPGEPSAGSATTAPATPTTSTNDKPSEDVVLARAMGAHAEQGVVISELMLNKTNLDPGVQALAVVVAISQRNASADVHAWLIGPGRQASSSSPSTARSPGSERDRRDSETVRKQMLDLERADGPLAERLYLQLMARHHQRAGAATDEVLARGHDTTLVDLARRLGEIQATQLKALQQHEKALPPPLPGLTPPSGRVEPR